MTAAELKVENLKNKHLTKFRKKRKKDGDDTIPASPIEKSSTDEAPIDQAPIVKASIDEAPIN